MFALDEPWLRPVALSPTATMTDDRSPTVNDSEQSYLKEFGFRAVDQATLEETNE